jgi:hypothetical protein
LINAFRDPVQATEPFLANVLVALCQRPFADDVPFIDDLSSAPDTLPPLLVFLVHRSYLFGANLLDGTHRKIRAGFLVFLGVLALVGCAAGLTANVMIRRFSSILEFSVADFRHQPTPCVSQAACRAKPGCRSLTRSLACPLLQLPHRADGLDLHFARGRRFPDGAHHQGSLRRHRTAAAGLDARSTSDPCKADARAMLHLRCQVYSRNDVGVGRSLRSVLSRLLQLTIANGTVLVGLQITLLFAFLRTKTGWAVGALAALPGLQCVSLFTYLCAPIESRARQALMSSQDGDEELANSPAAAMPLANRPTLARSAAQQRKRRRRQGGSSGGTLQSLSVRSILHRPSLSQRRPEVGIIPLSQRRDSQLAFADAGKG